KGARESVRRDWQAAFSMLQQATQIRVLGYSLADSDMYVRYLLKTAALKSERLKRFDVICLDPSGAVAERYQAFVEHPALRFASASVSEFLAKVRQPLATVADTHRYEYSSLEQPHEALMGATARLK